MKRLFALILAALMLTAAASVGAVNLSPALDIISDSENMTVALPDTSPRLKSRNFKDALGLTDDDVITVTSLPESGTLKYNGVSMWVGEELAVSSTDYMYYEKGEGEGGEFTFTVNDLYSVTCSVSVLSEVNFAPTIDGAVSVFTYNNTSLYGVMSGSDPENDKLCFDIESYPKKGLLTVLDRSAGTYMYTPYENCSGEDSFSYRVHDEYGNYSESCEVNIDIEKNRAYVFSDLSDCKSSVSAVNMVKSGIMAAEKDSGRILKFLPRDVVSRQDFVISAMKLFGADNLPAVDVTSFADDADIPAENKPYLEAALKLGFISGEVINDELYLDPNGEITVAEACGIVGKILGVDEVQYVMAGTDGLVSPFAEPAVMALYERGVFDAYGLRNTDLSASLTREVCAELLYSIKNS